MSERLYGETPYTLKRLLVSRLDTDGTNGTPAVWADGQMYASEPDHDTDKMPSYGTYSRGLSVAKGCKISIKGGGIDVAGLSIIANMTVTETGASGNRIKKVRPQAGKNQPYFSVIGQVETDDDGTAIIGHKKVMLDNIPTFTADGEANKFIVSEMTGYSFPQDGTLEFIELYEDETDWVEPTDGTIFAAFFA